MSMIHFACKRIEMEEIVRCSFALSKTEYKILSILMRSGKGLGVSEIAARLSLDRTGIQKSVKGLVRKKLAERKKSDRASGGFSFLYSAKAPGEIRRRMKASANSWVSGVFREIDGW
ncbi:MAG: MarR family transcriptional regulator [archaeon]